MQTAALSFPIIPPTDEREPTDAERADMLAEHVHDVIAENTRLERDLKSLRVRNATLLGALNALRPRPAEMTRPPELVNVYGWTEAFHTLVRDMQRLEREGAVAVIRPARNLVGAVVGVELSKLTREDERDESAVDEFDPTFRALAIVATRGARA